MHENLFMDDAHRADGGYSLASQAGWYSRANVAILISAVLLLGGAASILGATDTMSDDEIPVSSLNAGAPYGVHLSFTEDPTTTTTVTWFTESTTSPEPYVEYADTRANLENGDGDTAGTYASHSLPHIDVMVHKATIRGLSPGQQVFYQACGDTGCTDVANFTTDDGDGEFRLAQWGDNGIDGINAGQADAVMERTIELDPDLLLIAGDLSYAEEDYEHWDIWFEHREPLFNNTHVMPSPGNHEIVGGKPAFNHYLMRHATPGDDPYYSFDYGNFHFVSYVSDSTTQTSYGYGENMTSFMEEDLSAAYEAKQADEIDHIAVYQHHQIYSNHCSPARQVDADLAATEEQWLHRYDVKLLLVGHNHHYERTYPMAYQVPTEFGDEYEDPVGWIEVINGGAGRGLYCFKHPDDFTPYSADHAQVFSVSLFDVDGEEIHSHTWGAGPHEAFNGGEGTTGLIDEFWLTDTTGPSDEGAATQAPKIAR